MKRRWWDFNIPWRDDGRESLGQTDSDPGGWRSTGFFEVNDTRATDFLRPLAISDEQYRAGQKKPPQG